jgi:ribosome-binding protein aMBF1 (putative translation factor)
MADIDIDPTDFDEAATDMVRNFPRTLKELRKTLGWSQQKMAWEMPSWASQTDISRWENGKRLPRDIMSFVKIILMSQYVNSLRKDNHE